MATINDLFEKLQQGIDAGDALRGLFDDWLSVLSDAATVAALSTMSVPAFVGVVETGGYHAVGDCPPSTWVRVASEPAHPGKVQTGNGVWLELKEASPNIRQFGVRADAAGFTGTENSVALQNAIEFCKATGARRLYAPAGRYLFKNNSAQQITLKSSIMLQGDGMGATVFAFDDSASTSRRDFIVTDWGDYDLTFEHIGFEGDWGRADDYTQRSHLFELRSPERTRFYKCRFSNWRLFAVAIGYGSSQYATSGGPKFAGAFECEFWRGCADGFHVSQCDETQVSDCIFKDVNDDAIGIHSADVEAGPISNRVVVTSNIITDSQGIAVLGAKHSVISGNTLTRVHCRGIFVGVASDADEGNTASHSIVISGNVITDLFAGTTFFATSGGWLGYIVVKGKAETPVPGSPAGTGYVGGPNGAGGIVAPYAYLYTNNVDGTGPISPSRYINITGNTCVRTLQPGAAYSSYGYGERLGRGGPVDPTITSVQLGCAIGGETDAIRLENVHDAVVSGGVVAGVARLIAIWAPSSSAYLSSRGLTIQGVQFSNWLNAAIVQADGVGHVAVEGCEFNGDPFHSHPDRSTNGRWVNTARCFALWAAGLPEMRMTVNGCKFRNVWAIYTGAYEGAIFGVNFIYAQPSVGEGYHANNGGIASMPIIERLNGVLTIEGCDPSVPAEYGQVLSVVQNWAGAVPSGWYPAGHVVRNLSNPPGIVDLGGVSHFISGWIKMTTGTGTTLGSDWRIMYQRIA